MVAPVFTDGELEGLRRFPEIGREDLFRFFTLTPADVAFVDPGRGRGPTDRLGLAVAVCTLPWLKGNKGGRRPAIKTDKTDAVRTAYLNGRSITALAREHGVSRGAVRTAIADLMPEHTAAAGHQDTPAPELPVTLDMPGKIADFLRAAELEPNERSALDHGVTVRRGQGYTLRVSAAAAVHRQLLKRCQPLDGTQGTPAQRKARREYENRVNALPAIAGPCQRRVDALLPVPVLIIGFAIFAQGTSELMLAGLLPELATDLGVTIPQAGLLISGFALGLLVGAPALAILTLRWPRRRAMIAFLAIFALAHVVGALTSSYAVLFAARFAGAFVYAGFWAVGGSTAMALVPADRRGRAMSIVAGGLTVATVMGLPAGTWTGQHLGWRGAFWVVAALAALAIVAVLAKVPDLHPAITPRVRDELRGLATPRLWLSYAMTAVSTAALLGTFSFLGAMLIDTTGLDAEWVPAVLFTYGAGALLGIASGGRAADRQPLGILAVGFSGLLIISVALALTAAHPVPVVILVLLLGLAGFGTNPALNSRVLRIAPAAPTLAVAGNISAFNVGISAGPWLGGIALTAGLGYPAVAWISACLSVVTLALLTIEARLAPAHHSMAPPSEHLLAGGLSTDAASCSRT